MFLPAGHPVNALPLRGGIAQLRDAAVDRLRHPAQFVRVGLALLAEAAVREPLVEGLRLDELLVPPAQQGIQVVRGVHLVELPKHEGFVAPLEGHHRSFIARECFVRAAPCTGPAAACTLGPALALASS